MALVRPSLTASILALCLVAVGCAEKKPEAQALASPAPWEAVDAGWTRLADPPEVRHGAAYLWAGSELLAWGGCTPQVENDCVRTGDGFAFDPATDSWTRLPEAPLAGAWADAVWTGSEALFVNLNEAEELEGVAFDPGSDTWRAITPAPVPSSPEGVQVWTGTELIVWGGGSPGDAGATSGAAYNPVTDTWRRMAEAPRGLNAARGMWTDSELLVFGSMLDDRNRADTRTSIGLEYNPASDSWREIAPSRLSPQATSANWIAGRMIAWDYEVHWQEYAPTSRQWSLPQMMPFQFNECYPDSVVAGDVVFAFFCGQAALYDPMLRVWRRLVGGPLEDEMQIRGSAYKVWRFASLVPAGDVVFMPMEGITVDEDGVPCYGCPRSPHSFWSYRIPR